MIIGTDIIAISRVAQLISKKKERFLGRNFTINEIRAAEKYGDDSKYCSHFAKRFAGKEAVAKALGTGFGSKLSFMDIEITNNESGKPEVKLSKPAEAVLESVLKNKNYNIQITLSDDAKLDTAIAFVVIIATQDK